MSLRGEPGGSRVSRWAGRTAKATRSRRPDGTRSVPTTGMGKAHLRAPPVAVAEDVIDGVFDVVVVAHAADCIADVVNDLATDVMMARFRSGVGIGSRGGLRIGVGLLRRFQFGFTHGASPGCESFPLKYDGVARRVCER